MEECRREVEEEQDEVRLVCREGLEVYTHKAVLGLISPMLRSILASCPTSYPTLLLPDYRRDQVQFLLKVLRGEWWEGSRVSLGVVELLQDLGITLQGEQEVQEVEEQEAEEQEKEVDAEISLKEETFPDNQETVIHATTVKEKSIYQGYSTMHEVLLPFDEIVEEANVKPSKVALHSKVKKVEVEEKGFLAMISNQENQEVLKSHKSHKRKLDHNLFPVKKVKIMLENINKNVPVELGSKKIKSGKNKLEIVPRISKRDKKDDLSVICIICDMNFRDQNRLSKHYCHKHFYKELGLFMPQYGDSNSCQVCGLQFLYQNSMHLRNHIGIDHEILNKLISRHKMNDQKHTVKVNGLKDDKDNFSFSDDSVQNKQFEDSSNDEDDPRAISLEEIQNMLLPYQDDPDKVVSKENVCDKTYNDKIVEDDDEIIEVAVPPKPEAPLIDLELEGDDDSRLISLIDKCRQLL